MDLRFGTKDFLLVVAFIAIWLAGIVSLWKNASDGRLLYVAIDMAVMAPLWLPLLFIAFAVGRARAGPKLVVTFAVVQGVATLFSLLVLGHG